MSANGVAHFIDKEDVSRRVFLMFSVEDIPAGDLKESPNVMIANMAGNKTVSADIAERERQEILLYSNLFSVKYKFVFTSNPNEVDQKKNFYKLLNSFIEGEDNVKKAIEEEKKKLAEEEVAKIKTEPAPTAETQEPILASAPTTAPEAQPSTTTTTTVTTTTVTPSPVAPATAASFLDPPASAVPSDGSFRDLIDANSMSYERDGLSVKIPWGFWYRSFQAAGGATARVGVSDQDLSSPSQAKMWVELFTGEKTAEAFSEKNDGTNIVIEVAKGDNAFVRISGPAGFRDALMSIAKTVQ
jgi:hypothetical protein